ncbi:hypothetical protein Daus18300_004279 [Diaporthe australafricana]|uniref:J domain-containing protein n=1 Tax=Diaporthe australafricana TaxID=127596 RepID=A0ABR3X9U0_9PEZI
MSAPLPPDPYQALGVDLSADAGVIKTAYRKLVLKCHPDKFPDPLLKAQKQDEFQRVQQAYEILGDEDRKRDYDLEVKAKKLKEELAKRGGSTSTQSHSRFVNVNIRTAEPPPGWSPSKHSTSKSSPYKPAYSREFSQSWEHEIPSRSKVYHEDERRAARRTASYEKVKREDSRERRRRNEEDRERERRRDQDDEIRKEMKRQQKLKDKELRERELRDREREHKERKERKARDLDAKLREDARLKAEAKAEKKMRERERDRAERERDLRRKQEATDEKARAKPKPYVEHSGYSEDDDDVRRSRAKKSSSPKKQSASPSRDKSSTKQRDRSNPQDETAGEEKWRSTLAYAASYVQQMKNNKPSKTSPRHTAEVPAYSAAYPDPNEKFAPSKRRASGDGKHASDPVVVDIPDPSAEAPSTSPTTQQAPPRLQKSHTMPSGYMPQAQTTPAVPPRVPLGRSYTMQPEHISRPSAEKHRPTRRAFDDEDYMDDRYTPALPRIHKYQLGRDKGIPRVIDSKYDSYASPGLSFSKIKTAPSYSTEHVMTAKHYEEDDVATSHYDHMQPSYADYSRATPVR